MNRRRALQTIFCSSLYWGLGVKNLALGVMDFAEKASWQMLALGDFGSGLPEQGMVARAMMGYREKVGGSWDGMLALGDNFYGSMLGGECSERWRFGFEEMYPREKFPERCWAILGNHDYHDEMGNEKVQLGYAAKKLGSGRWCMPREFYRVDGGGVTLLMVDTNWRDVNVGVHGDGRVCWISEERRLEELR